MGKVTRTPCKILHTSDLQISTLDDEGCRDLEAIANLTIKAGIDLVLIAGDLFDHDRIKGDAITFVVEQLKRLPAHTIILPGNHDCLVQSSAYYRRELWQEAANIQVLRAPQGETLTLPDLGVAVWGKPITSYKDDVRPLVGMPQSQGKGQWNIAMAHGYYADTDTETRRAFQISKYEIINSHYD